MSLVVENLSVIYGSVRAARSISLTCEPGQIVTIVGPNGAGKSSVLNAVAGASEGKVTGRVSVDGVDLTGQDPEHIIRTGVALVPEGRRIFTSLSVEENLQIGAVIRRDKSAAAADIQSMYERFPALARRRKAAGATLSGGEAQQLAIARALVSRPRYLLLDETFARSGPADYRPDIRHRWSASKRRTGHPSRRTECGRRDGTRRCDPAHADRRVAPPR